MSTNNQSGHLESALRNALDRYANIMEAEQRLLQEKQAIYSEIALSCIKHRAALDGNFELSIGLEATIHKLNEDLVASTKNLKRSFDILHGTFGRYWVAGHGETEPAETTLETNHHASAQISETAPSNGQAKRKKSEGKRTRAEKKSVEVALEAITNAMMREIGKGARKSVANNFASTVAYLIENGPSSGDQLQTALSDISKQTFGSNMRRLREMGWIETSGKARGMRYLISEEGRKKVSKLGQ